LANPHRKSFVLFGLDLGRNGCIRLILIERRVEKVFCCLAGKWAEMAVLGLREPTEKVL
jgi:hypothetical protein